MGSAIPFTRMAVPITVVSVAGLFEAEVQDRSANGLLGCALPADQRSLGLLHHWGRRIYSSWHTSCCLHAIRLCFNRGWERQN